VVREPGPLLLRDADLASVAMVQAAGGTAAVLSRRCPDKQGPNEDGLAVLPGGEGRAVLAVADGVGGQAQGESASRLALEHLADCVAAARAEGHELRKGVLDGFEAGNRAIREHGHGAATTLVVVELDQGFARTYHAGDSMALVTGQRGRLRTRTMPHSPVGYGVEAGLIAEKEALVHDELHLVDNALGDGEMRIEVGPRVKLGAKDTVLLASDGLWDNLAQGEILERARKGGLEAACAALADAADKRMRSLREGRPGKSDDLTLVLWRARV
jgi:serine/threonine protein phosphatase PrpC